MRISALAPVCPLFVLGVAALVATVALVRAPPAALRPVVFVPVRTASQPPVEQPAQEPVDERSTVELLDGYEQIALSLMNNGAELDDRELRYRLLASDIEADVEVYRLSENERVIRWDSPPPKIHGGGARASVFAEQGTTWKKVGHVDSADWTSFVWSVAIDAEQGIAIMVEGYDGLGAPPSRAVAFAVDRGSIVSVEVDRVPRIDVDTAGPQPVVSLWRNVDDINPYSDAPLRGSRWQVRRTERGLIATETPITPWIDALAQFCNDPSKSDASPALRAHVVMCVGRVEVRWAAGPQLVATLPLRLQCGDDQQVQADAELRLEARHGRWRVIEASSCPARESPP